MKERVLYGVFGIILLALSSIFAWMAILPYSTDKAFGYVASFLLFLAGILSLCSSIRGPSKSKED